MTSTCGVKALGARRYRCFFELTLQLIGGKWKPIILYHLAQEPMMRFGALRRSMPDVTERMLTKQLRELEADRLIHREVYREVPPRVEYSLTPLGCSLIPILLLLRQWGMEYERAVAGEASAVQGGEARDAVAVPACRLEEVAGFETCLKMAADLMRTAHPGVTG